MNEYVIEIRKYNNPEVLGYIAILAVDYIAAETIAYALVDNTSLEISVGFGGLGSYV